MDNLPMDPISLPPKKAQRKRGRPPGVKNREDSLKTYLKKARPKPTGRGRAPEEFRGYRTMSSLKLDTVTHAVLKLHAFRRQVPMVALVSDILNLWIAASTDYEQKLFQEVLPKNARAAKVPERWPGYIASLGFVEEVPQADPIPSPLLNGPFMPIDPPKDLRVQPVPGPSPYIYPSGPISAPTHPDYVPPQLSPQPTITDLTQAYRHPLTQGPSSYPHPSPSLPQGAAAFDPQNQPRPQGAGNAAQRQTDRPGEDVTQPYTPEVLEYIEQYRVRPEDVR